MTKQPEGLRGLRIYKKIDRPDTASLDLLRNVGVGDASDAMRGVGVMDSGIKAIYSPMNRIFGPAITVDLSPGDGLLLRAAVEAAQPGDVIVANAHGVTDRAILGGSVGMHIANHGVKGLVVDGAARDMREFRALDLPVMARAVTPRSGTSPAGWGEVNVPIACGGAVVMPGDVIIGDDEGLIVVPRKWVRSVVEALGDTGHAEYKPETIKERLRALRPDSDVTGIDGVRVALAERKGTVVDGVFDD